MYAMNDKQRLTDRIQCGGRLSYDTFVPLNDYAPIPEAIPNNSVDLVVCFIGLHHIPQEKLQSFVASIRRILRPGGTFILRDHDITSPKVASMAHAAHSVFNAIVTAETVESETAEYRNFQPLSYWISLLEHNGFKVGTERLLQAGDPTINTLVKFTKVACTTDDILANASSALRHNSQYQRNGVRTYLNGPEWLNVDASQDYGTFVQNNNWYEFPHLRYVASYWNLFAKASKKAAADKGFMSTLTSEYTKDNLFIGTTMTAEYIAKSIAYLPNKIMCWKTPVTQLQKFDAHVSQEYGSFLEHTPWYAFPYFKKLGEYWQVFKQSGVNRKNVCLGLNRLVEFTAKGLVAVPVGYMCAGTAPATIQLLVHDPHNQISRVDHRIKIVDSSLNQAGPIKLIEVPRYKQFGLILEKLAYYKDISIAEIAGNTMIQLKIRYKKDKPIDCAIHGCTKEYTWHLPTQPEYEYASLMVHTSALAPVIKYCHKNQSEIMYIHDF